MGILGIPTRSNKGNQHDKNEHFKHKNYTNQNAVEKLIRYVTRTRADEYRQNDLIIYGAVGAVDYLSVEDIIQQFCYVQNAYGINRRQGRRMYHEVFNLSDYEAMPFCNKISHLEEIGRECCQCYYVMGFQVVFAVHWEQQKRLHFHFAVNSINFKDGHKWHSSLENIKERERIFNQILQLHRTAVLQGTISPIFFE